MRSTEIEVRLVVILSALLEEIRAFAQGRVSLNVLQRAWLPDLVAPVAPVDLGGDAESAANDEHALFWQLVWLFESDAEETRHREHARRIVACMDQTDSAATLSLLPLIVDQDRFCDVVGKYGARTVSLTALRSVIAESRYDSALKHWLARASPSAIVGVCEKLRGEQYAAVAERVSRPPA